MAGFGHMSMGSGPFGLSSEDQLDAPPDPAEGARFIDPKVRDYLLQSNGDYARLTQTKHRVLLALLTKRGSMSGALDFGTDIPGVIDEQFERDVQQDVAFALQHLQSEISLIAVKAETAQQTGRVVITVRYLDLATLEEDAVRI